MLSSRLSRHVLSVEGLEFREVQGRLVQVRSCGNGSGLMMWSSGFSKYEPARSRTAIQTHTSPPYPAHQEVGPLAEGSLEFESSEIVRVCKGLYSKNAV